MIAVLAGNYQQYLQWCRDNRMSPGRDAKFIQYRHDVQGMSFDERTRVGTWWTAPMMAQLAYEMTLVYMHREEKVWGNC